MIEGDPVIDREIADGPRKTFDRVRSDTLKQLETAARLTRDYQPIDPHFGDVGIMMALGENFARVTEIANRSNADGRLIDARNSIRPTRDAAEGTGDVRDLLKRIRDFPHGETSSEQAMSQLAGTAIALLDAPKWSPKPAPDAMQEALTALDLAHSLLPNSANRDVILRVSCFLKEAIHVAPMPSPDGAGEPPHWREVEMMRLIDLLRSEEGDCVEIFCDNPDFGMGANNAVSCNGWWTGFKDRRFEGESLLDALSAAMIEYKRPKSSDGGVGSQTRKELSADAQSLMAAGNVDSLGVAPGPSETSPSATGAAEPVAWRWKPKHAATWIYDPEASWLAEQNIDTIDVEPLYAILSLPVQPGASEREATYTEICMNEKCPRGGKPVEIVRQPPHSSSEGGR